MVLKICIILSIADVSHPSFEDQIGVVNETLKDLDARDKPIIMVFNKIDAYVSPEVHEEREEKRPFTLEDFKKSWMAQHNDPALFISATQKENLEEFKQLLYDKIVVLHTQRYPYDKLLY